MSKSKVYKKKKQANAGIFVILAVILVALIAAIIIFTSIDNSKYNGLVENYTEHEYGEKKNVKLARAVDPNTNTTIYISDDFYYYPDDNVIYDMNKNASITETFNAKSEEISTELGTVEQAFYSVYNDGTDFDKEYGYLQVTAKLDGVLGSEEAAAEKIWNYINALGEEYNVCGLYCGYSDSESYYQVIINVIDKETVTLEKIQEGISSIALTGDATIVTDDAAVEGDAGAENAEGDAAE